MGADTFQEVGDLGRRNVHDVAEVELAGKSALRTAWFAVGYLKGRAIRLTIAAMGVLVTDRLPSDGSGLGAVAGEGREFDMQIRPNKVYGNARDGGGSTPVSEVDGRAFFQPVMFTRQLELALVGDRDPRQGAVVAVVIVVQLLGGRRCGGCQATTAGKKRCRSGEPHCNAPKRETMGGRRRRVTRPESVGTMRLGREKLT
jgi:hypothetical protein